MIRHKKLPIYGVQFHPEFTDGKMDNHAEKILEDFLEFSVKKTSWLSWLRRSGLYAHILFILLTIASSLLYTFWASPTEIFSHRSKGFSQDLTVTSSSRLTGTPLLKKQQTRGILHTQQGRHPQFQNPSDDPSNN